MKQNSENCSETLYKIKTQKSAWANSAIVLE